MTVLTTPSSPAPLPDDDAVWLRRYRPSAAPAVRLVCFPHAGGAASAYLPLARTIDASVEVLAVQYPGRQDRRHETPLDSVGALVEALLPELLRWTGEPFAFFGHSLGATVAHETARRLAADGAARPVHLFLSSRRPPSRSGAGPATPVGDDRILAEITAMQGTDAALLADQEMRRLVMPALRADYRAAADYRHRPGPVLDLPLTVLGGDRDEHAPAADAPLWADMSTGPCAVRILPGGHFYLKDHVNTVCRIIEEALGHARTEH